VIVILLQVYHWNYQSWSLSSAKSVWCLSTFECL